jgi:nitrogen regulatory protein P-II 1
MKEVKAIVKPFKVNDILNQLLEAGFPNLTVSMAEGTGNFISEESTISIHFSITDSQVAQIELICNDSDVDKVVGIILSFARTGNPGDGIIYITNVESLIKVKTGNNVEL